MQTVKDPAVALASIEAFLVYVRTYLLNMPEEEYQTNVQALVDAKLEKAKNYSEQGNRYVYVASHRKQEAMPCVDCFRINARWLARTNVWSALPFPFLLLVIPFFYHDPHAFLTFISTRNTHANRYWNEIDKGSFVFDRAEREAAKVKGLTKEDLVRFLDECVGTGGEGGKEEGWEGGRKMVVVVHGSSHPVPSAPSQEAAVAAGGLLGGAVAAEEVGEGETNGGDKKTEETKKAKKHVWVTDPSAFKRVRPLYPLRPQVAVEVVGVAEPCSATATE